MGKNIDIDGKDVKWIKYKYIYILWTCIEINRDKDIDKDDDIKICRIIDKGYLGLCVSEIDRDRNRKKENRNRTIDENKWQIKTSIAT